MVAPSEYLLSALGRRTIFASGKKPTGGYRGREGIHQKTMKIYSQRDPKWANEKLGFGSTTIGSHGCKLTSFAMLDGRTPTELNELFKKEGCFSGDLLDDTKCAQALGWTHMLRTTDSPSTTPCIAEVDMSPAPGKQQHFVVWLGDGNIIDPWGGVQKKNTYKVYSYRLYEPIINDEVMNKDFVEQVALSCGKSKDFFGDNINEKEQEDATKRLKEYREEKAEELVEAEKTAQAGNELILELQEKIKTLESSVKQENTPTSNETAKVVSIDDYTLGELVVAFFRKITRM